MDPMVRPRISVLDQGQKEFIHARSLEILSKTGVRVDSPKALEVLRSSASVHLEEGTTGVGPRARFDEEVVNGAIESAPAVVDIHDRRGELAFRLGQDRARFGVGATNLYYQDPLTDRVERFSREDMAVSTRLGQDLPNFDMVSTMGVIQDYPPETADLYATLEMVANTAKPLVVLVSDEGLFEPALDLLETVHPGLSDRPFVMPYLNPITPLIINGSTGDKLVTSVERGLPVIYSNLSLAGMSTPITAAGTLVLLNAELLAGLVVAQLTRAGASVILGSLPGFFDMRTLQDFYDPHSMVANLACAEMMAHYGVPHAGTSGSGIGWGTDLAASGHLWMNHLLSLMGQAGIVPFVGGNLGSKAFSPVMTNYSNDVIGQALRVREGFSIAEEKLDLEAILKRGPGGSFLDTELTMTSFREAYYESELTPRLSLEEWENRGQPRFEDLLREHTVQLLEDQKLLDDHDEILARGEGFITARS
ncbi:trimethylamine methyltransferase family protein [Gemmatimonadota bacterium]